jgi:hypothetical protein
MRSWASKPILVEFSRWYIRAVGLCVLSLLVTACFEAGREGRVSRSFSSSAQESCSPGQSLGPKILSSCLNCHSAAGTNFKNFKVDDVVSWLDSDPRWEQVFSVIETGAMPPGGSAELKTLVTSCRSRLGNSALKPGAVAPLCVSPGKVAPASSAQALRLRAQAVSRA